MGLGFIPGSGHLGEGLQLCVVNFFSPGELLMLCELDLSREFRTSLFFRSSQIGRVDGLLMTMPGVGFRSYPGRVDKDMLPTTFFFWGACTPVILSKTGFCSGGGTGAGPERGYLLTESEGLGGTGTGMGGFLWMGGGFMGGWGTGGGWPLGW